MTTEPLSPQVIDKILEMGTATKLRRGQYVFREGDPGDHVYLVRRGRVKIVITTPTGRELVLAMKQAGQLVGEFAALDGRPRSASAMVLIIDTPR